MGAAVLLASCAPQPVAPNGTGPTFVSLNPCLDAILIEVAKPEQILALSHFSRDPASSSIEPDEASRFAVTGGTAEEVIALRPSHVIASTLIAPATRSALERAGLDVLLYGSPSSTQESLAQITDIAELVENPAAGAELIARIEAAPTSQDQRQLSALLWQPGQIVAGDTSLVAEYLRSANMTSHSAAMGLGQADYVSLEAILADPPELLLLAGTEQGQTHPLLNQLSDTHVAAFAPNLLYCAGPSIPKARMRLMEIRRAIQEEQG